MKEPIVFFDVETTGLDTKRDRIIEIFLLKINPDKSQEELEFRFNPEGVVIPEETQKIHGISNDMLINEPLFKDKVSEILNFIDGSILAGYNIVKFDLVILMEEIYRSGITYNLNKHKVLDAYKIWMKLEPRTLSGAALRFLKKPLNNAHTAKADVIATYEVMESMLTEFTNQFETLDNLTEISKDSKFIDITGVFSRNDDGKIIINIGKYKGQLITEIAKNDSGYFKWMWEVADFPHDVKVISRTIYEKVKT